MAFFLFWVRHPCVAFSTYLTSHIVNPSRRGRREGKFIHHSQRNEVQSWIYTRVGHPEISPLKIWVFPRGGPKSSGLRHYFSRFAPNFSRRHTIIFRGSPDFSPDRQGFVSSRDKIFCYWWPSVTHTHNDVNKK